jgi:hypothetical protein
MTKDEAAIEARKRWGEKAHVQTAITNRVTYFQVGLAKVCYYEGLSWEAAFAKADAND